MPLYNDFGVVYNSSEDIITRQTSATFPGITEPQNRTELSISTSVIYPATTAATALRESRIRAGASIGNAFRVIARTFQAAAVPYDIASITKSLSYKPALDNKETRGWNTTLSIDINAMVDHRDFLTITSSRAFVTSLSVTATTTLANNKALWILIMPIGSGAGGSAEFVQNAASITRTITASCVVVASAYRLPLTPDTGQLPQGAIAVYNRTS
jgi:hypothetical protein